MTPRKHAMVTPENDVSEESVPVDASKDSVSTDSAPVEERKGVLARINGAINGTLERVFDSLGRFIARRPRVTIAGALLVCALLTAGVVRLDNETDPDKLWVPSGTQAAKDQEHVEDNYPRFARISSFYLYKPDAGGMLTPEAFDRALALHQRVLAVQWANLEDGEREVEWAADSFVFTDICLSRTQELGAADALGCTVSNVLSLYGYQPSRWATREALLAVLNDASQWNSTLVPSGFVPASVLGGVERDAAGDIVSAAVLGFDYFNWVNSTYADEDETDPIVDGWEEVFLEELEAAELADNTYSVARFASRSFSDEFGETVNNDVLLLQVAIIAIALYTAVQLSSNTDGCVGSRLSLTFAGLVAIGMAVASTYGFCSLIGILYSQLMTILPFIMIGIGVDSMFVLVGSFDATDPADSMEDRLGYALRNGGVSVTLASLTNFFAFIIGSNTSLPALSAFSIYAAFGLLFDWIYQVTFFAAVMSIDARRQEGRRCDVFCCATSSKPRDQGICFGACGTPAKPLLVRVMGMYGYIIRFTAVKVIVTLIWAVLLGFGIWGASRMTVDADVNDFIPDGSYLAETIRIQDDFFTTTGPSVGAYLKDELGGVRVDFSSPTIWEQMDETIVILQANEYIVPETIDAWWSDFKMYVDSNSIELTQANFYATLDQFLATPVGRRHTGDIVFYEADEGADGIKATRFTANWIQLDKSNDLVDAMDSTRASVDTIPEPLGTNAFAFGAEFLQIEQYKSIGKEALMNIGLGFAMVAVVIIVLLASPVGSLLTFVAVLSAIVQLIGFMQIWGFTIDSVTVIFLVISLGLAVDYSVHVAHGFLANQTADANERVRQTMEETGSAVVNGAISTLLAALCLAASGSYVFLTFFAALLLVVLCGMFQGLFALPVWLTIFNPAPHVRVPLKA